jgi:hypothetical protein
MRTRFATVALTTLLVLGLLAPAALARNHQTTNPLTGIALTDLDVTDPDDPTLEGVFNGTLDITSFYQEDGELLAAGVLNGTISGVNGDIPVVDEPVDGIPVGLSTQDLSTQQTGGGNDACPILFLELGPVFLDVLGLVVEIPDPIVVDIRAEPGPGQLLGNLLCAVAGLLDGPSPVQGALDQIIGLLNRILDALG